MKYEIQNMKYEILNMKYEISNMKYLTFGCYQQTTIRAIRGVIITSETSVKSDIGNSLPGRVKVPGSELWITV